MSEEITSIEFTAENPRLQTFIGNKDAFRVLLDTGIYSWPELAKLPAMPSGTYKVKLELIEKEE